MCVAHLTQLLVEALDRRAVIWAQNPLRIDEWSEPEPDIALLRPPVGRYVAAHPSPGDALLVVEVADASTESDQRHKLPLYATAGIPEAWLVDLGAARLDVYEEPADDGYATLRSLTAGDVVAPTAFPDLALPVAQLLP